jgi:hypothetical protein
MPNFEFFNYLTEEIEETLKEARRVILGFGGFT